MTTLENRSDKDKRLEPGNVLVTDIDRILWEATMSPTHVRAEHAVDLLTRQADFMNRLIESYGVRRDHSIIKASSRNAIEDALEILAGRA